MECMAMNERLVDVLNARETVVHVFPIPIEGQQDNDPERKAVELAKQLQLVPEEEAGGLHARPHVCRGGQLLPYGDALETKLQCQQRAEQCVRERAYFLWENDGRPDNKADEYWYRARQIQDSSKPAHP